MFYFDQLLVYKQTINYFSENSNNNINVQNSNSKPNLGWRNFFMHWTTFPQYFISIFVLGVGGDPRGGGNLITSINMSTNLLGMGWDGWGGCQIVDPIGTYQKILAGQVQFPAHFSRRFYAS